MPEVTASSSMSMPHSEAAPSSPSAASTTPLPEPISEHLGAPHRGRLRLQHLDQGRRILARSQGGERQLGLGVRHQSGLRHVNYPKTHTSQAQSPPMPFAQTAHLSYAADKPFDQRRRHRIVGKFRQYLAVAALRCQSVVLLDQSLIGKPRQLG